jgi:DNA topoisomerase-3
LALFDVLQKADPALVDPGVTAQMERLLDDVLVGQQEMVGAIDAVCAQASRIIGRLTDGTVSADVALLRAAVQPKTGGKARRRGPPRKQSLHSRTPGQDDTGAPSKRANAPPGEQRRKQGRKLSTARASAKRSGKAAEVGIAGVTAVDETLLRIPFGNKEAALALGARYRAGGWYAPLGVDLGGFRERGWL